MTGAGGPSLAATERRLRDAFTAAGETVAPGSIRAFPGPGSTERTRWAGQRATAPGPQSARCALHGWASTRWPWVARRHGQRHGGA